MKLRPLRRTARESADKYEIADLCNEGFGRFVRRCTLMYYPQLWLVVLGTGWSSRGDPRACRHLRSGLHKGPLHREACCTGLWQIAAPQRA